MHPDISCCVAVWEIPTVIPRRGNPLPWSVEWVCSVRRIELPCTYVDSRRIFRAHTRPLVVPVLPARKTGTRGFAAFKLPALVSFLCYISHPPYSAVSTFPSTPPL